MKRICLVALLITVNVCIASSQYFNNIEKRISDEKWNTRDSALAEIKKGIDSLKGNKHINSLLYKTLQKEIYILKSLSNDDKILEDNFNLGYGEYVINLADLIIELDLENLSELIIDFIGNGKRPREAIIKKMLECDDTTILNMISEKYFSKEKFYSQKKSSYIFLLKEYLKQRKDVNEPEKNVIIKNIVLNALKTPNLPENKYIIKNAQECAEYFPEDRDIQEEITKINKKE
jgi:hypothetical protein